MIELLRKARIGKRQHLYRQIRRVVRTVDGDGGDGMPLGICTVASSASSPSSVEDLIGMPITGSVVCAASTPAKCAAFPAAAMITPKPFCRAVREKRAASSGVRCAESTRTSTGTPEGFQSFDAVFDHGEVRIAAHDDGDFLDHKDTS